jgi:AcrR family transcriptional regulator
MAGRRPGAPDTRGEIVAAARTELALHGYDGTSIRAVARRAAVDPALVHHYFKDKQRLVSAAFSLSEEPADVVAPALAAAPGEVGPVLVRTMVASWDDPANREAVVGLARSGLGRLEQGAVVRDFVLEGPVGEVLRRHRPDASPQVAGLVLAQMIGLVAVRYLLEVEPIASMSADEVAALVGPAVQRIMDLDRPLSPA